jgi:hypothetical protein
MVMKLESTVVALSLNVTLAAQPEIAPMEFKMEWSFI